MQKLARAAGTVAALVLVAGCAHPDVSGPGASVRVASASHAVVVVKTGAWMRLAPGILFQEVELSRASHPMKVWTYLPERAGKKRLPCILIAPAGTRLFHGTGLGESDRPEHLPYVRAGFAVVAYEIDGPLGQTPSSPELADAASAFMDADAGILNAKAALDYVLGHNTHIDPVRIYTAGHSSAATLSLQVAENDPRIRGCIAYAPACFVPERLGARVLSALDRHIPGFSAFITAVSPDRNTSRLRCPVFLFHADDDSNVPTAEVAQFAQKLEQTNPRVTFVRVPRGNHYESMIQWGIPLAIRWLTGK